MLWLTIGHQQPGLRVLDHVAHAVGRVVYVNRHVVFAGSQHAEQEHGDVATFSIMTPTEKGRLSMRSKACATRSDCAHS